MDLSEHREQPTDGGAESRPTTLAPNITELQRQHVSPTGEFSFGRRLAFAIDDDSIQMVAASHVGPRVKLLDATKFYLASDQKSSENRQLLISSTIKEYVSQFGGRWPTIALTLTGPQTALRSIVIPELKGAELASALNFEGRRQIPFPAEDCWIDSRVTEIISDDQTRKMRASVFAATKLAVQETLSPFVDLGFDVGCVYQTQDVLGQLLRSLPNFRPDANYTLINIHSRSTEIAYFHGSNLEFFHVSSLGSSFLANRSDPTVFEYFAESLATEIQNSLDFYGGQFTSGRDPDIFIYGDLAYTEELIDLISDRHGLRFRRFPGEHLHLNIGDELAPEDICVNLAAVAAAVSQGKIANLLPTPAKRESALKKANRIGIAATIFIGFVLIAQWLVSASSLATSQKHLDQLEAQAAKFQASEMFATYNRLKRKLIANQAFIAKTREEPSYLGLNLKELSHQVPPAVHLYNLEFSARATDNNYQLSGLVSGNSAPPELILAEMVENLIASPFFEDVIVERHVKRRKSSGTLLDFTLSMRAIT